MKKILTVSLFAMMAVSAANADIASTAYVEGQTGTLTNLTTTAKGNLVAAINEVDTNIGSVTFASGSAKDATNLTEAITLVDAQVQGMSNNLTENITKNINELQGDVDAINSSAAMTSGITKAKVDTYDGYSALITTAQQQADKGVADAATAQAKADANETAIGTINNETTGILAQAKTDAKTKADKALEDAKAYTDGEIDTLEESLGTTSGNLSSLTTRVTTAESNITSLQSDKADTEYVNTELGKKQNNLSTTQIAAVNSGITKAKVDTYDGYSALITTAQQQADKGVADAATAQAKADANETAIGTINNETTGILAQAKTDAKTKADKALEDAKAFTTEQIEALGKLATIDTACAQGVTDCALVIRSGEIKWEKVTY